MKSRPRVVTRRRLAQMAAIGAGTALRAKGQGPASSAANATGVTRQAVEFILATRYADIPADVIALGKKSILDGLGLALVGSAAKSGELIRTYLRSLGIGSAEATVAGSSMKTGVRFAALANGIGIHADDYDDTQLAVAPDRVYGLLTHPTAPCLAAALSLAEARKASGRDLLLAYQVGVEVETKIAEAIFPRHYQDGFHSTGTCGSFAAAAAAAKLRGFNEDVCARTLGIAASQAAGLRENFGTMTKPFHAGHAAEAGIVAADLALLGWTASDHILEADNGFFHAAGGGFDATALRFGKPWTLASPGVSIKPFPSGSLTHPAMSAMQRLIREYRIKTGEVDFVDVGTNRNMPNALIHHRPMDSLQAKFSMEFCMAALLLYGRAGLAEFNDEVVRRPEVQAMIQKIRFGVNAEAEKAGYDKMTSILDIHMKDGRTISGRADIAKGNPADPMTFDEVAAKFEDCARFAKWPAGKANSIIASVRKLEEVPDVRSLTAHLSA